MNINWKRKLSSRKFWAAVCGVVISVMVIFGADSDSQERIAGAISSAGVLITYIFAEGAADRESLRSDKDSDE